MNTQPMPCVSHAVAIRELTRYAREAPTVANLVILAQFCATEPVVEIVAHGAAMVVDDTYPDEWLDHCAVTLVPELLRACGVLNTALDGLGGADEVRVLNELANLDAAMEPHAEAVLLADASVWAELTALELFPECGGAWWCDAYAESLATAS